MTKTPRETRVLDAVVSLVDSLLADPFDQLHVLAATTKQARDLEVFQLQVDQGPCLECYASGQPVSVVDLDAEEQRWPRFVPAAREAGFRSVHAVPMRAAGLVLGALGLFGSEPGELAEADLLVAQTLAHIACVAILQEHAPTPSSVLPQLRSTLARRVVVEQAKGFLRQTLDVSVEEAFKLLRSYAHANGEHLTDVARQLMTDRRARPMLIASISEFATASTR